MHPVVAIYSTFLNRAFDQIMMDVALHRLPVTMVLDRAGITGSDGASHNGMWDLSMLGIVPGMRAAAPATPPGCARNSVRRSRSTTGRRRCASPKVMWARTSRRSSAVVPASRVSTCSRSRPADATTTCCWWASARSRGWRWRWPSDCRIRDRRHGHRPALGAAGLDNLLDLAARHKLVVTCEDNGVNGGVGSAVSAALRRAEIDVPCRDVGLPQRFYEHASRGELLADLALTDQDVARRITGWVAALGSSEAEAEIREHLD